MSINIIESTNVQTYSQCADTKSSDANNCTQMPLLLSSPVPDPGFCSTSPAKRSRLKMTKCKVTTSTALVHNACNKYQSPAGGRRCTLALLQLGPPVETLYRPILALHVARSIIWKLYDPLSITVVKQNCLRALNGYCVTLLKRLKNVCVDGPGS